MDNYFESLFFEASSPFASCTPPQTPGLPVMSISANLLNVGATIKIQLKKAIRKAPRNNKQKTLSAAQQSQDMIFRRLRGRSDSFLLDDISTAPTSEQLIKSVREDQIFSSSDCTSLHSLDLLLFEEEDQQQQQHFC